MPRFNHGMQDHTRGLKTCSRPLQEAAFDQWEMVNEDASVRRYSLDSSSANWGIPLIPYPLFYRLPRTPYFSQDDGSRGNRSQWIPISFAAPTNIYLSTFFAAQGLGVKRIQSRRDIGLDILRRTYSLDAPSDSPLSCHPGTRVQALEILTAWAAEITSAAGSILWLKGPAGVGKSAILGTLTHRLRAVGRLGASFIFRRQHSPQENADALFCTLAYQLAINIPHLRTAISRAVTTNPGIVGDTMEAQLQKLILRPCRDVMLPHPLILVIDGLDEFTYEAQREILTLLRDAAQAQPSSFRVIVASRLEHHIGTILAEPSFGGLCRSFDVERSATDIQLYLWTELARVRTGPISWLSPQVLDALVEASSGCFLYASTLVKFLVDQNFSPTKRLESIQSFPFSHLEPSLDKLYAHILAAVPLTLRESLLAFLHVLTTEDFSGLPLYHIGQLLRVPTRRLRRIIGYLDSVLHVPASESGITMYHASFMEFLADPARSGAFCVSGEEQSKYLACCILESLAYAHQNPRVNRVGSISWKHLNAMVDYATSRYPSSDFLPLVKRINPDFFFGSLSTFEQAGGKILTWLNKMHPRPVEEISVWEDYAYMAFFHSTANDFDFDEEPDTMIDPELELRHQILLRYPELIRLLRFSMVVPAFTPLFQFRMLLGISWGDLRGVVCALRPIFGRNDAALTRLWMCLQAPEFARGIYPWPSVFRDLAIQSLRIMNAVHSAALPPETMGYWLEWGRYVRSAPPCPELLRKLSSFGLHDDSEYGIATENEIYDVIRWFESIPDVPQDEKLRWAGYLLEGTEVEQRYAYEGRWASWIGLKWYDVSV
ncbi:AAA-16 domain-containing protein [Mycena sanguinolenta]|uniref:AAA-16 domain-containing protein n=1 Tax=Mycena sanguinolenta TaxID=230812 RepID=A0A8H6YX89_9AGAR|nr:AAA-16 domain-containing protein [Mycena sanguinolenta]